MSQIEALLTVRIRPIVNPLAGLPASIPLDKRHAHIAQHHLQRLLQVTDKPAAQHLLGIQCCLPGGTETRHVQAADFDAHLVDVIARFLLEQGVKQHALLHRRQRVDVLDLRRRHRQPAQLRLGQARQREVRRSYPSHAFGGAMRNQLLQFNRVFVGQPLHGVTFKYRTTEGPAQAQLAAIHLTIEAERRSQWRIGTLRRATAVGRGREQRALCVKAAVELAQVIEHDAALRQCLQGAPCRFAAQITQRAVTNALVRHCAQLLLDGHDRLGQRGLRGEPDRVQVAEPADRAGDVQRVEQVLAAMPFQTNQRVRLRSPAADHPRQRGQQQVVDLRAIGRWCVLQQLPGQFAIQLRGH
ncbi:Uncharacterized protein AC502_1367 [Pseudomonas syringae pv. maculicola]|nr:Uncharacterized protein AC503_3453 [Pseudomonas syringae pv. maculicola]KPB91330.1 Uncharacterized protein AC502_1367 [Pseudomonas syringae pv. maculicola]